MASLDPKSTVILCIDMQNDFLLQDSPLCVKGGLVIVGNCIMALDKAREMGIQVFYVIREHDMNGMDIEYTRSHLLESPHDHQLSGATVPGTEGAKLIKGLEVKGSDRVFIKKRFSAFFSTNLDLCLRRLGVKHVILTGVQTPNCIRATAVDAIGYDYLVTVLSDATASKSEAVQRSNLEDMRAMGIQVATTTELFDSKPLSTGDGQPPSLYQASLKALASTLS